MLDNEEDLREAYTAIKQMDNSVDQAAFLNEFLSGKNRTPASYILVEAVSKNMADEIQ